MKLTASIVTYKTDCRELERILGIINLSSVERIYIIDNGHQREIEQVCKGFKKAVYIPSENKGYGAGHNKGLRKAIEGKGEFHLVMNSDVCFAPESLGKLVDYMDANPDVGCLQPKIVNTKGELQYTVRKLPMPIDLIGRRFLPRFILRGRLDSHELRDVDHSREFDVPCIQGSFMFIRLSAVEKVGLFDERFFMYAEDIDLSRRIHEHFRTMYVPFVTVVHEHRQESYHSLRMLGVHCLNVIRYFNKWGWISQKSEIG